MRPSLSYLRSLFLVLASASVVSSIEVDAATFAKQKFDFIVCGGGTAGTALAVRLSEVSSFKVGLIEGGKYHKDDPWILIPQGMNFGNVWGNEKYDWKFETTPQRNLNNRSLAIVRGKGLGGSSMVNLMGFMRAGAIEYDQIVELGNPGWSWDEILPYYKKAENHSTAPVSLQQSIHATSDPANRGHSGPIHTSFTAWFSEIVPYFTNVLVDFGMRIMQDANNGTDANYIWPPLLSIDQETETRSYAANAYYEPNSKRKNLMLLLESQVTKVELSRTKDRRGNLRATGVTYVDLTTGKTHTASVTKEVIVTGGGIQTPQILELSGIGNKKLLQRFGIEPRIDLPVGENYQDHLMSFQSFEVPNTFVTWDIFNDPAKNATAFAEYKANHSGIYTAGVSSLSYMSLNHIVDAPTLRQWTADLDEEFFATNPSPGRRAQYAIQRRRLDPLSTEASMEYYCAPLNAYPETTQPNKSYIQVANIPSHQFSRGSIHIQSKNPLAKPAIDLNVFDLDIDRKVMLMGTKFAHKFTDMMPLKKFISKDVKPPKQTDTDAEWLSFIRETSSTPFHPCCTAAMMPKQLGGVVDPRLVVYGTSNLRVADVSILPIILATHLMGTAYAIGERAADFIKEDFGVLKGPSVH